MKHRCKDDISVGTCHETKLKGRWSMRGLKKVSWFSKRNKSDIGSLPDISVTCQQLEYPLLNDKKINKLVTFAPCSFGNHVKEKRQNVCSYGDVDDKRQNACSYEDHIEDKRQNAFESSSFGKVENKRRNTFDSSSLSNVEDKRRNTTTGKQRPWISCDDQYVGCMKESKFFDSYKHCRSLNSLSDSLSNLLSISSSNLLSTEIDSFVPGVANYLKTAELCQIAQEVHSQQTDEWFRLNKQYHSWPKQKHSYLSKINHVSSYHNFGLTTGSSDDGTNRCHGKQQRELFLGSSHVENRSLLLKRLQVTDISHEVNDFNDIYSHRKKNANPQQQDEIDSMINYEKQRKLQFETLSPILRRDIKENRTRNTFDLVEGIYEKNPKIYNVNEVKNTSKSVNTKDIFTNNVVTPFDQVYSSIFEKHGTSDTDIQIANRTSETDTDIQIANVSEDDFSESINELLKTNEIHECVNLEHTTKNTDASGDMDGDIFDDLPLSSSHIVVNNTINKADNEITLKSEVECEECTQFSINSTFSNSCDCINESSRTTNTEEVDESSKTLDSSAADQDVKCPMKDHHETISSTSSFDDSDDGGTDSGVGQQSDFNPLFNHNIGINPPLFKKRADLMMQWFADFCDEQKNIYIQRILESCGLPQMHMLSLKMELKLHKHCPENCRDMLQWLPENVVYNILEYMDPKQLSYVSQVNRVWHHYANNGQLWQRFCRHPDFQLPSIRHREQITKHTAVDGTVRFRILPSSENHCNNLVPQEFQQKMMETWNPVLPPTFQGANISNCTFNISIMYKNPKQQQSPTPE